MQDVLIIRRRVEAIRHSENPASMTIEEWKSIDEIVMVHYPYASCRKHLFQYGQRDNNVQTVGEAPSCLRKTILLIETHIDSKDAEYVQDAKLFKISFEQFIHTGPSRQFASPIQLHASISPLL